MNILPNAYYNYLKAAKEEYRQEKKKTCDKIREIYHNCGGNIGHRFYEGLLGKGTYFSLEDYYSQIYESGNAPLLHSSS